MKFSTHDADLLLVFSPLCYVYLTYAFATTDTPLSRLLEDLLRAALADK